MKNDLLSNLLRLAQHQRASRILLRSEISGRVAVSRLEVAQQPVPQGLLVAWRDVEAKQSHNAIFSKAAVKSLFRGGTWRPKTTDEGGNEGGEELPDEGVQEIPDEGPETTPDETTDPGETTPSDILGPSASDDGPSYETLNMILMPYRGDGGDSAPQPAAGDDESDLLGNARTVSSSQNIYTAQPIIIVSPQVASVTVPATQVSIVNHEGDAEIIGGALGVEGAFVGLIALTIAPEITIPALAIGCLAAYLAFAAGGVSIQHGMWVNQGGGKNPDPDGNSPGTPKSFGQNPDPDGNSPGTPKSFGQNPDPDGNSPGTPKSFGQDPDPDGNSPGTPRSHDATRESFAVTGELRSGKSATFLVHAGNVSGDASSGWLLLSANVSSHPIKNGSTELSGKLNLIAL